jgi:SAM-dependent MidA family methyltransferase
MSNVSQMIAREIRAQGPITFARFMDLALYCPDCGYYEAEADTVGRSGDFITAVSSGELFGQLLAFQFSRWIKARLRQHPHSRTVHIVEAGAHDGRLARDILGWIQENCPDLYGALDYWIVEPSTSRRAVQKTTLRQVDDPLRWAISLEDLWRRTGGVRGVIFSNELLDAMPVNRYAWDAHQERWFEWGVGQGSNGFEWCRLPGPSSEVRAQLDALCPKAVQAVLPDGYILETSASAGKWWADASKTVEHGWLVTFDYGFKRNELITPERTNGTLRAYSKHRVTDDVLSEPGKQDITAHVDFATIEQIGLDAGLQTHFLDTQSRFIRDVFAEASKPGSPFGDLSAGQTNQLKALLHPDHFGRSFRALIQSKGVGPDSAPAG